MSFITQTLKCKNCHYVFNVVLGTFGFGMPEKCGNCHTLSNFESVTDGKWTEIIPDNLKRHVEDLRIPVDTDMDINDIRRTLMKQKFLDLREKLAEQEHERWSSWQKYLHDNLLKDSHGDYIMPGEKYYRWQTQIETPYNLLSEKEKDSDREQVDRYWPLIEEILKVLE